jgi:uncharacterized membrane protein YdbT with pleckstrin-like domain
MTGFRHDPRAEPRAESVVWEGRPSALADVPFYLVLLGGAVLASLAVLFLLPAAGTGPDAARNARLFSWVLAGLWVLVVGLVLQRWITWRSTRYVLTTQRLRVTTGVLSTVTHDLELRRVRDTTVLRTLYQRLTGTGDVRLDSADRSTPRAILRSVRDPLGLQDRVRDLTETLIRSQGVREIDVL